ncbi:O-antigen ligase family protein [Candidatus Parcubacteria bacterium]|jgi:O-antigen ligase|nr:O-antigen ligase family protein [Candidatus Parcubacteria bacterium]MBT7228324.1 O-antigen ligase family protein [Candidatus Parcubacteria bacterium]
MSIFIAILFFIVFFYLSCKRPVFGLSAIIVLLPTYLWRYDFFGLPTTFLELMIVSLFIIWLCKDKKYKRINFSLNKKSDNPIPPKLRYTLLAWLLVSLIGLATNFSLASLGLWRAYFLEPMMFFLIFIHTVRDKKDFLWIIKAIALLLSWLFVVTVYQYMTNWNFIPAYNPPNDLRLTGIFSYPNALSLLTAPLAIFLSTWWLTLKNKTDNIYYLLAGILGLSLSIFAISQGAMLAILISVAVLLILAKKTRKWAISLFSLAIILFIVVLPKLNIDLNPDLNLQSSSVDIRLNQWNETLDMLGDKFILGAGIDGYQTALQNHHQTEWLEIYLYPHNIFLNFWTELGLLGLLVFIVMLSLIVSRLMDLFKDKNKLTWPLTLVWTVWFVHGLVDVPYFKNDLSILFFALLAITFYGGYKKQKQKN